MKKILVLLAALFVCAAAYVPCRAQYISGYADLSDSDVTKTLKNHISYLASEAPNAMNITDLRNIISWVLTILASSSIIATPEAFPFAPL